MTLAYIGSQTLFQMGDAGSPETFLTVGEVTKVGPISVKKDLVETTSMLSTAKEFIGGLSEGQEFEVTCNNIPSDVKQALIWTTANSVATNKNFKYVFPATAAGGTKTLSFAATIISAAFGETTPNGAVPFTFSLKVSGAITGPA